MIQVETLKPHGNAYGDKYTKSKDDRYELPEPQAKQLIADGLIKKLAEPAEAPAKAAEKK
jgi:hypothetical protein